MEKTFKEYEGKIPNKLLEEVKAQIPKQIPQARLKKILDKLLEEYNNSKIEPGESVGLIGAESIGFNFLSRLGLCLLDDSFLFNAGICFNS